MQPVEGVGSFVGFFSIVFSSFSFFKRRFDTCQVVQGLTKYTRGVEWVYDHDHGSWGLGWGKTLSLEYV